MKNTLKKMAKSMRSIGLASLLTLTPTILAHAGNAHAKDNSNVNNKKIEWNISAGYNHFFSNPAKNYVNDENNKNHEGFYTSGTPMFVDLENKKEGLNEIKVNALFNFKDKKWSFGPFASYSFSKQNLSASGKTSSGLLVDRADKINYTLLEVGMKEKKKLNDSWNLTLEQALGLTKVDVDSRLKWTNTSSGVSRYYDASSSGKGILFSLGAGVERKISNKVSLGADVNYTFGKVSTKGTQVGEQSGNTWIKDENFSHTFNWNGITAKLDLTYKF